MSRDFRHLVLEEREEISIGLSAGLSIRQIARILGRRPSTISREVNRSRDCFLRYRAVYADRKASHKARISRNRPKMRNRRLFSTIKQLLSKQWSPEQIAFWLKKTYPDNEAMQVSHETIYRALYVMPRGSLKKGLLSQLRQAHKHRHKHTKGQEKRGQLADMAPISSRPKEVEDRRIPGHWEGDLIKGRRNKSAIGTLVERTSRLVVLVKMNGLDAESARKAFERQLSRIPRKIRKTLTYDRGKEMAEHKKLAQRVKIQVYFADPRSPWQRATCENTNGLLRQYFPKGMSLSEVSQKEMNRVAQLLNTRPRKGLNWDTPLEAIQKHLPKNSCVAIGA
jgi:IS30 family transposase